VAAEALSYGARCLLARRRERKPQQVPSGAHPTHKPKGPASALLPPAVGPAWVFRASKTLPQHHCRHARPLLRWPGITLRKRPPGDGPGRTRTCDPLLRRREHLLRATAPCRSSRSASDGSHTAAAFCCGLPLPPRFHVDPPATAIAMSATAPLLLSSRARVAGPLVDTPASHAEAGGGPVANSRAHEAFVRQRHSGSRPPPVRCSRL
jgi:hypothetical protein